MPKKYGGVDNKKDLDDVQEAFVVGAPKKSIPKRSIASTVGDWVAFIMITYILLELFLVAIDVYENPKIPLWAKLVMPLLPTLVKVALTIIRASSFKDRTKNTSCL